MSETISQDQLKLLGPVILGVAGDIGRTTLQQLLAEGVVPVGVVLRDQRLESEDSRLRTAAEISRNYAPRGAECEALHDVELTAGSEPVLRVGEHKIPVFTEKNQHEILEGRSVIDATGNKASGWLEELETANPELIVITRPVKDATIPAIVFGVNGTEERFAEAKNRGMVSASSCTTTAVTSGVNPILEKRDENGLAAIAVNVVHSRTKSNIRRDDINSNIVISSSGGIEEIPRILGLGPEQNLPFRFTCSRVDANCGSVAEVTLTFGEGFEASDADGARSMIEEALAAGTSSYALDDEIKDTWSVIGRQESAVINLSGLVVQRVLTGTEVSGLRIFSNNVAGYTRSVLDTYVALHS